MKLASLLTALILLAIIIIIGGGIIILINFPEPVCTACLTHIRLLGFTEALLGIVSLALLARIKTAAVPDDDLPQFDNHQSSRNIKSW